MPRGSSLGTIAQLKYVLLLIITFFLLILWQQQMYNISRSRYGSNSLRDQRMSEKLGDADNMESDEFERTYGLAKNINKKLPVEVIETFKKNYCPKVAASTNSAPATTAKPPVNPDCPLGEVVPDLSKIRDPNQKRQILDSLKAKYGQGGSAQPSVSKVETKIVTKEIGPTKDKCLNLPEIRNAIADASHHAMEAHRPEETTTTRSPPAPPAAVNAASPALNTFDIAKIQQYQDNIEALESKIKMLEGENLEMMQEHTIIEKKLNAQLLEMKAKSHEILKTKVQNTIAPPTSGDNDKLPFCDDLFKRDILENEKYAGTGSRNKKIRTKATKFELEGLISKTGVQDGCWSPRHYCRVRQSVAIIVPYRDREHMFSPFLFHMHSFLQKQHREYCIILAEQADQGQFNRAKIFNAGFEWTLNKHKFWSDPKFNPGKKPDCFIFHDIDLLPEDIKNLYGCLGYSSNHMCDKYNAWSYETQRNPGGTVSAGGAISVSTWQYKAINGHSNRYWGWGYEDHEASVRFRAYNATADINVPSDRQRHNDFMNEIITGITDESGDVGMMRADKFGYYTQLSHGRGFTNSKNSHQFFEKSGLTMPTRPSNVGWWIAYDGLNTNFYQAVRETYMNGYAKVSLEIRPFIPKRQEVFVDKNEFYDYHLREQVDQECTWVDYWNVDKHKYESSGNKLSDDEITNNVKSKNEKQKLCDAGWKEGTQCNGIGQFVTSESTPFPLYTVGPDSQDQIMTIRNCKDSFGLFQALPDIILKNGDQALLNKHLKMQVTGELQQMPKKYRGLMRIYYEGKIIKQSYQIFGEAVPGKKVKDEDFRNNTRMEMNYPDHMSAQFMFEHKMAVMPPGMYMIVWRITDMSSQLFLDTYSIVRVRVRFLGWVIFLSVSLSQNFMCKMIQNLPPFLKENEDKNFELIQEYRSYVCSAADKRDPEFRKYRVV